jgi:hypothetical protein
LRPRPGHARRMSPGPEKRIQTDSAWNHFTKEN